MTQFVVIPPLTTITALFTTATGRPLVAGVGWSEWHQVAKDDLEAVRPYIRPCHQHILEDTIAVRYRLRLCVNFCVRMVTVSTQKGKVGDSLGLMEYMAHTARVLQSHGLS